MAKKTQKAIKRSTGEWLYCTFSAKPEEKAKYQEIADSMDRSLSWWIRKQLNQAAGIVNGSLSEVSE